MTCSDWIGFWGAMASTLLGVLALWQNFLYKKQSDNFSDIQFMPEIFFADKDGYIPEEKENGIAQTSSLGYGYTQNLGKYFAINTPIYNLEISKVIISDKRVDTGSVQRSKTNVYPTKPYVYVVISIPAEIVFSGKKHEGTVVLTYENMYGTKYKKEIDFTYKRESPQRTIHSREIKNKRAERIK